MFNVYLYDGKEIPKDEICVILAKEGVYMKKRVGVMESIAPIKGVSFLPSIETMAKMHIPKLPAVWFAKTVQFFRAVEDEHSAEAIVLPFYNEKTKKYRFIAPVQQVSGAAVDYKKDTTIEGMLGIGTIHSHSSMSAFHSGVDDKDEETFDGLHITVGNLDDKEVSISASIVSNGHRVIVDPEEYIEGIKLTTDIDEEEERSYGKTYKWDPVQKKMVETESKTYTVRKFDKRYTTTVPQSKSRPSAKWIANVEYKPYAYTYNYYGGYGGGYGYPWLGGKWQSNNKWGRNFDPHAWNRNKPITPPAVITAPGNKTLAQKNQEKINEEFKDVTGVVSIKEKENKIVCETCHFKDRAIEYAMRIIAANMQDPEEREILDKIDFQDGQEVYRCEECNSIVVVDEDDTDETD